VNLDQVPVISIIDDDQSVREATKSLLRSLDYKALTFCSAEEFLSSAQVAATTCLITDVQMPGIGGVELQNRLIAGGHRMPIIFITAFPDERVERRVLQSGAIGYLRKRFNEDHLIDYINAALDRDRGPNVGG
jgi:FixJ family two-component response regulator